MAVLQFCAKRVLSINNTQYTAKAETQL